MNERPTKLDQFGPQLQVVIREMCKRGGVDADTMLFKDQWFWDGAWTKAEQDRFRDWLANYLLTNKDARHEMLESHSRPTKRLCNAAADEFVWLWGWKVSDNQ